MQEVFARLSEMWSQLTYILINPAFNPKIAFLLYATAGVSLLFILLVGILLLVTRYERSMAAAALRDRVPDSEVSREQNAARREEFELLAAGEVFEGLEPESPAPAVPRSGPPPRRATAPSRPKTPRERLVVAAVFSVVLIAIWAAVGYTTSDSAVCKDCHWPASQHAKAEPETDPHTDVACVSCHEPGGFVGRYLAGVPGRLVHLVDGRRGITSRDEYGRVGAAACSSCHAGAIRGVATDKARGLKISHKEPLAASATCVDCHTLRDGAVRGHNVGMNPCLRCHDSKQASARCATCHDQKTTLAARARTTSFAKVQIADVSCGGCHDEKQQCDWCHGTRLPHSVEFKRYAHARAGAVDFWYNGGKACARCHTATRRPCQRCHGSMLGRGHGPGESWLAAGHQKATVDGCDTCHRRFAWTATRDFCEDLCHTPAARATSPR